jgi:phosphatidylinositol alpha 1,6-mannosyltransferase
VPSRASWDQLSALGVGDLHLWRRGVALDVFGPQHRVPDLNARWTRRAPGSIAVGYVGRLAPEKQVRRLAEVATVPGTRLVVVGDGPSRASLRKQLPGAVFTGMLRGGDLAHVFASLDVFVHPGESETYCQTVQEAQASGVPVVAPAAGGPLDLVHHGRAGLLYDPSDPSSLRDTVARLVGDVELRRSLATAGLATVGERTWERVVDELIDVHYAAVIVTGRPVLAA